MLPEISTGEPLVNAFIDALEGKPDRFKQMIGYGGGKTMQEGITEEVIQVLQARAERRELSRKWFATWEKT